MLADCCSSREAVISRTSFCFDWPRAYSLLLTPTAFDEPVFRRPVVCVAYVACAATATSNHPFKLLIPVLRVLRLLHELPLLRVRPLRRLPLPLPLLLLLPVLLLRLLATCGLAQRGGEPRRWAVESSRHGKKYRSEHAHSIGGSEGDSWLSSAVCPYGRPTVRRQGTVSCSVRVAAADRVRPIVAAEQHIRIGAFFDRRFAQFAEGRDEALPRRGPACFS